jgi:hypothetical protein
MEKSAESCGTFGKTFVIGVSSEHQHDGRMGGLRGYRPVIVIGFPGFLVNPPAR